ncbi:hypothetical protein ACHAWF_001683 [Thalassiosira exigua]
MGQCSTFRWDSNSFTDCRPSKANDIQDEIIETTSTLSGKPTLCKDISLGNLTKIEVDLLPHSLHYGSLQHKGPRPTEWTLEDANEKAKEVCQEAIDQSRDGYKDLQHTKTLYD